MQVIKKSIFLKSTGLNSQGSKGIIPVGFVTSSAVDNGSVSSPLISGQWSLRQNGHFSTPPLCPGKYIFLEVYIPSRRCQRGQNSTSFPRCKIVGTKCILSLAKKHQTKNYCLQVNRYGKSPALNHSTSSESATLGKEAAFILQRNNNGQKKNWGQLNCS